MSDWEIKNLGDLLDRPLAYGVLKPGPYEEGGIPLVRIQDHKDGEIKSNSFHKIPFGLHQEFRRTELRAGDIIISVVGTIGRTAIIPKSLSGANVSRAFAVIGCSDEIDNYFLDQYLKSDMSQTWFREQCQGNAQQVLNLGTLREYPVPIPPLPEQKKIAEILSGIDAEINYLAKQSERCSEILQTISEDLFNNCNKEFPSLDLAEACSVITKGATPTTFGHELSGIRFPDAITFLGGGSTSESGEFDQTPARYCASIAVSTLKRSDLREGDTLITIVGASVGNTCQVPKSALPANINQNVALVRGDKSVLDGNYLNLYLRSEGRRALVNIATTQAQPSVSLKQVGEIQIPIPPISEQCRISEAVTSIRNFKNHLERKVQAIQVLKKALSADLLSGRKRVSV